MISVDPRSDNLENEIRNLHELGCIGFKIHPRFLKWDWTDVGQYKYLKRTADYINKLKSTLFFCTYFASTSDIFPKQDPLYIFSKLTSDFPTLKIIFTCWWSYFQVHRIFTV